MFKKFSPSESVAGRSQVKTSVARKIRKDVEAAYPMLGEDLDALFPKKAPMHLVKCLHHVQLVVVENRVLFIILRDTQPLPTLKLLHQYPNMLPHVGVDRGAIPFVLKGAPILCPGLTSKGGDLSSEVGKDVPVAVMAEGKTHAIGVGITRKSAAEMREVNKDVGVESISVIGDGLWDYDGSN